MPSTFKQLLRSGPTGDETDSSRAVILLTRYGLGWVLVLVGTVVLILDPGGFGVDGFAMAAGSGFSILMLNWFYRLGVSGDREREQEEAARRFLAEHGRWPNEGELARRSEKQAKTSTGAREQVTRSSSHGSKGHRGMAAARPRQSRRPPRRGGTPS